MSVGGGARGWPAPYTHRLPPSTQLLAIDVAMRSVEKAAVSMAERGALKAANRAIGEQMRASERRLRLDLQEQVRGVAAVEGGRGGVSS